VPILGSQFAKINWYFSVQILGSQFAKINWYFDVSILGYYCAVLGSFCAEIRLLLCRY
jgi:hypothetical protein